MIKIDKNVPITESSRRTWPFNQMKKGDSFLVPKDIELGSVRAAASYAGSRGGMKFSIKKTPKGYRCWRVK